MLGVFSFFLVVLMCRQIDALEQCNRFISNQFLARKQLEPTVLQYLCGNGYWRAAVSKYTGSNWLVKFKYGTLVNNACNMSMVSYSTNGTVLLEELLVNGEVLEDKYLGYYISSMMAGYYTFQCSYHLVAMYRCQMSWQFGGPKYLVYAPLEMSEVDISEERECCKKELTAIDSAADMVDNHYPSFP